MRYILLVAVLVLTIASCKKKEEDDIVETRFTYTNSTNYKININVYRKALDVISFKYSINPHDSLALDFRSVSKSANPFGAPEVDSAEIVFDAGRKLIYTITGPNGPNGPYISRNIFFVSSPGRGYTQLSNEPRKLKYTYDFTNTDYFNAR